MRKILYTYDQRKVYRSWIEQGKSYEEFQRLAKEIDMPIMARSTYERSERTTFRNLHNGKWLGPGRDLMETRWKKGEPLLNGKRINNMMKKHEA